MDVDIPRGEGFRSYYITKIEELQLIVAEKSQNLRRLQAQRNELNAKGNNEGSSYTKYCLPKHFFFLLKKKHSSYVTRGTAITARTRQLCR